MMARAGPPKEDPMKEKIDELEVNINGFEEKINELKEEVLLNTDRPELEGQIHQLRKDQDEALGEMREELILYMKEMPPPEAPKDEIESLAKLAEEREKALLGEIETLREGLEKLQNSANEEFGRLGEALNGEINERTNADEDHKLELRKVEEA